MWCVSSAGTASAQCAWTLPSCGTGTELAGLTDDVQAVRAALDGCARAVVCGHSYAGLVVTEAAAGHPAVRHLIYLAAAIPDTGDSLASLAAASARAPALAPTSAGEETDFRPDGRIMIRPDSARASLFHDCDDARASDAIARLRPINPATGTATVTRAAWRDIPATYVRCTQDRLPYEPVSPASASAVSIYGSCRPGTARSRAGPPWWPASSPGSAPGCASGCRRVRGAPWSAGRPARRQPARSRR